MRKRIWIPESFIYTHQEPEISMGFTIGFGGYFMVDLIDAKSGKIREHYEFFNLITDLGLDQVAQTTRQSALFNFLGVGTDATVPTVSDTALGAEVTRVNSNGGFTALEIDGGPITGSDGPLDTPYFFKRLVRLFLEDEGNGNLTELGWFDQASDGVMIVRSLFKDSGGIPIVLTKTSADQLRIIYEFRIYPPVGNNPPLGDPNSPISSGTVILGPTTHSWTGSAINIHDDSWGWGSGDGMLAATLTSVQVFSSPSGSALINPTGSTLAFTPLVTANTTDLETYSVGSFQRDMLANFLTAEGNFGTTGINMFTLNASPFADAQFQIAVSGSIPKTTSEALRVRLRVTIDRVVV